MKLLLVQLDISLSATIEEAPQILVVVKVSLFISVPLPNDEYNVEPPNETNLWTASSASTRLSANPSLLRSRIEKTRIKETKICIF